jgi:hypothetical protein
MNARVPRKPIWSQIEIEATCLQIEVDEGTGL